MGSDGQGFHIISLAEVDGVKAFVIPFNVEFGTLLAFSKLRYSGSLFPRSHPMMPVAPGMKQACEMDLLSTWYFLGAVERAG